MFRSHFSFIVCCSLIFLTTCSITNSVSASSRTTRPSKYAGFVNKHHRVYDDYQPQQIHLAVANQNNAMIISYTTLQSTDDTYIVYGTQSQQYQ